jgi:hypothetical protein
MLATEATSTSWKKKSGILVHIKVVSKNFNTNFGVRIIMEKIIGTGI